MPPKFGRVLLFSGLVEAEWRMKPIRLPEMAGYGTAFRVTTRSDNLGCRPFLLPLQACRQLPDFAS